jgi:hypothetical protein
MRAPKSLRGASVVSKCAVRLGNRVWLCAPVVHTMDTLLACSFRAGCENRVCLVCLLASSMQGVSFGFVSRAGRFVHEMGF